MAEGIADPARIGVTGGSYGGFMSSWLITQDQRFAAAAPLAPVTDWVSEHLTCHIPHFCEMFLDDVMTNPGGKYFSRSPIMFASEVTTPSLNICGALDHNTPAVQALEFHHALLLNGVESVLLTYPQEGHGVRQMPALFDFGARRVVWFQHHMPVGARTEGGGRMNAHDVIGEVLENRARRLIGTALVWDNHTCMPLRPDDEGFLPQLERFREAGVDVVGLNVGFGPLTLETHLRMLAAFRRWFGVREDLYLLVDGVEDIDRAKADGRLAVFFDIEGMGPLDAGDHGLVQLFHDLGVRWMSVAYNRNNAVGGGCYDEDPGLSSHGRAVLAEMKRVGMAVCCSHTGHRTALEVFAEADNPVIFSHSNPSAAHDHTRNIPDELVRACAATGGVVGVNGIGPFLGDNDDRPETLVHHIDYIAQLVGPDHVGIALDYVFDPQELADYLATMSETFPDDPTYRQTIKMVAPEAFTTIVAGLLKRGYGDEDVRKILGGNWRRVAEQVWR